MSGRRVDPADADAFASELSRWVRRRLDDDGLAPERLTCEFTGPVPTGNSNVTMPFTARWHGPSGGALDLVLRMQVPANQIFLDPDVLREHLVLNGLTGSNVPSPTPRWAESDPDVLGEPFFVMSRVRGTVPTGAPSIHAAGWLTQRTPDELRVAWNSAIEAMAAVSAVDWQTDLTFLADGAYGTTLESRLAHATNWYRWVVGERAYPITDHALAYLKAEMPSAPGPPVLAWGDARMGNLIFGPDHRVAAILDWELASIGPPGIDLGWWLAFDEFTTHAHGVVPLAGYPDRSETIDRYEQLSGLTIDNVRWYEIYCAWVLTVTVIRMADIGVTSGRLPADNRMGHGNLTAQMLARWLDLPVPDLDAHYAARRGLPVTPPR